MLRSIVFVFMLFFSQTAPCFAAFFNSDAEIAQSLRDNLANDRLSVDGFYVDVFYLNLFYSKRDYKPAWHTPSADNKQVLTAFLNSLRAVVDYHGLPLRDYPFDQIQKVIDKGEGSGRLKSEILISHALLRLGRALHGDLYNLALLYPGWNFDREPVDVAEGLANALRDDKVSAFVTSLEPKDPTYHALASLLKSYRAKEEWDIIPKGQTLKPGMRDERLIRVRERLAEENYLDPFNSLLGEPTLYNDELLKAVKLFQESYGLTADGVIGSKVISTMNVPLGARIRQIRANMERIRNMPDAKPERLAIVNIPEATLVVRDKEEVLYEGNVVVGRPDRKTPFIQSKLRSLIFNPAWRVPRKIAVNDILPKLRKDPHYLEKLGFVVNGLSEEDSDAPINWHKIRESEFAKFRLRQAPGEQNSLGRLKFDFDNDFAVYMHGTPHLELFDKDERLLSSGCIRLRDPETMAEIVLKENVPAWPPERIEGAIESGDTKWVKIAKPLPLWVVYDTVFKDNEGKFHFRADTYGHDRHLMDEMEKPLAQFAQNH